MINYQTKEFYDWICSTKDIFLYDEDWHAHYPEIGEQFMAMMVGWACVPRLKRRVYER